jgi:hypothetical protein
VLHPEQGIDHRVDLHAPGAGGVEDLREKGERLLWQPDAPRQHRAAVGAGDDATHKGDPLDLPEGPPDVVPGEQEKFTAPPEVLEAGDLPAGDRYKNTLLSPGEDEDEGALGGVVEGGGEEEGEAAGEEGVFPGGGVAGGAGRVLRGEGAGAELEGGAELPGLGVEGGGGGPEEELVVDSGEGGGQGDPRGDGIRQGGAGRRGKRAG